MISSLKSDSLLLYNWRELESMGTRLYYTYDPINVRNYS